MNFICFKRQPTWIYLLDTSIFSGKLSVCLSICHVNIPFYQLTLKSIITISIYNDSLKALGVLVVILFKCKNNKKNNKTFGAGFMYILLNSVLVDSHFCSQKDKINLYNYFCPTMTKIIIQIYLLIVNKLNKQKTKKNIFIIKFITQSVLKSV